MKLVLFYHSLSSDWNHGNAHFLRGVATELCLRGHSVQVYEPADGWSAKQLVRDQGQAALDGFKTKYPLLEPRRYTLDTLDLDSALGDADVTIVHEWNPLELVARIGQHRRRRGRYLLLFHDTHHRAVSAPEQLDRYPLESFDGTLAFGDAIAAIYRRRGWSNRVFVWHEAADTRVFSPEGRRPNEDFVWIGNWGDDERSEELRRFLFEPVRAVGASGSVYGVRYPQEALAAIAASGLRYRGWAPNHAVPEIFARHRFTVHVPRRFYRETLLGIPTIRVFEALACGIPLICAPWPDSEHLFRPGRDFLVAETGSEMQRAMRRVLTDAGLAADLAAHGRATIEARHTCAHRVDELLDICAELGTRTGMVVAKQTVNSTA